MNQSSLNTDFASDETISTNVHPEDLRHFNIFYRPNELNLPEGERVDCLIDPYLENIVKTVTENPVTIVEAETGAGKSSAVPEALLEAGFSSIITQPRRIAARHLCHFVAHQMGVQPGDIVGYQTAIEQCNSSETELQYVTDGLALRKALCDDLGRYDILIMDEVHEFNLNIELLLGWAKLQLEKAEEKKVELKELGLEETELDKVGPEESEWKESRLQEIESRRLELKGIPDFKLVIMSATMQSDKLARHLSNAPVIRIPGKEHKIYEKPMQGNIYNTALFELKDKKHNVLIFQPGKREIQKTIEKLREHSGGAFEVLPLHADLLPHEQDRCFQEYDKPICVVATDIAQTSVTIPNIDTVIDSGWARQRIVKDGKEGLYTCPVSLAGRRQRMGRSGRTKVGYFYDNCPVPLDKRSAYDPSDIFRSRLDQALLKTLDYGLKLDKMPLFHKPIKACIHEARKTLEHIGCIENNQLTETGRRVAELPLDPRLGVMLLEAQKRGVSDKMVTIAAIIENGPLIERKYFSRKDSGYIQNLEEEAPISDLLVQLDLFMQGCEIATMHVGDSTELRDKLQHAGIKPRAFFNTYEARNHLVETLEEEFYGLLDQGTDEDLIKSIYVGMPELVWHRTSDKKVMLYENQNTGEIRELSKDSSVRSETIIGLPWDLETPKKVINLIIDATEVNREWFQEALTPSAKTELALDYDPKKDEVVANKGSGLPADQLISILTEEQIRDTLAHWLTERTLNPDFEHGASPYGQVRSTIRYNRQRLEKVSGDPKKVEQTVTDLYRKLLRKSLNLSKLQDRQLYFTTGKLRDALAVPA